MSDQAATSTKSAAPNNKRNGYSREFDLEPLMQGTIELPNFKEMPLAEVVNNVIACRRGANNGRAKLPNEDYAPWALFFLDHGQGGQLYGSGLVLIYGMDGKPRAGRFAICEHKKVDDPGANHMRGWHPGHCEKCGLDMSVDSGD